MIAEYPAGTDSHQYVAQRVQSFQATSVLKYASASARNSQANWYIKWGLDNGRVKAKSKTARSAEPVKAKTKKTVASKPTEKTAKDKPVKPSNQPLTFELKLDHKHPFIAARKEQLGLKKKLVKSFGIGFTNQGMMKERICFPIHNFNSELIAYSGRWASDELPEDVPRNLLPKGFEKSKVLYNLHRILQEGSDTVVIVEGFWSVLRLHYEGRGPPRLR